MRKEEIELWLARLQKMTDKDREWLFAMSEGCVSKSNRTPEDMLFAISYSLPGE